MESNRADLMKTRSADGMLGQSLPGYLLLYRFAVWAPLLFKPLT